MDSDVDRLRTIIEDVIRTTGLDIDPNEVLEYALRFNVKPRYDIVSNFLAALLVVRYGFSKKDVDRRVASSKAGRRRWEKKLRASMESSQANVSSNSLKPSE